MRNVKTLKWVNRILVLGVVIGVIVLVQNSIEAQIVGSAHDFSSDGWAGNEICLPCHTPHNSDTSVTDAPLWNHEVTIAIFTPYLSGTLDATDVAQPDGVSKLCLSCHDGTVALDSFGGTTGTTFISTGANVGIDLSNDHPISFTYDVALSTADGELADPATTASGIPGGGNIDEDMLFGIGNDQLECSSCHDVHNSEGHDMLLLLENVGSALCLTCHTK